MMITELISHHPPSRNNTPVSRDEARQVKQKPLIATRVTLGWPLPPFPSSTKLARGGPLKTVIFYFQDNSYHRVEELIMAQSVWNFFFLSGPPRSQLSPKMSGGTLEWTLPVNPLLPVSAGDLLSKDSLLQSLSTNLLTFCWEVKPPLPPSTSLPGGWTFTINEHWKKKTHVPMGISCPLRIVHVNVCPCWFGPSGILPLES